MQKIHIELKPGQTIWLTSDLHFGHRNIIRFCNRPFENEKVMGPALIDNWNNTVGDDDIVFVLGDTFWFDDSRAIKKVVSSLKGKDIYFLPGNHDNFDAFHRVDDPRIHLCADVVTCWITEANKPKRELYLQHCPASTWPHRESGAYHFFGHIHSQLDKTEGFDQNLPLHWNQADAGCDFWGWKPVSLNTLIGYCEGKKIKKELD
jgi:calcineurin-like phosphoesterase family protein